MWSAVVLSVGSGLGGGELVMIVKTDRKDVCVMRSRSITRRDRWYAVDHI